MRGAHDGRVEERWVRVRAVLLMLLLLLRERERGERERGGREARKRGGRERRKIHNRLRALQPLSIWFSALGRGRPLSSECGTYKTATAWA